MCVFTAVGVSKRLIYPTFAPHIYKLEFMERNEVLKQVNQVFIDVLDNESIVLNDETTANDIEEWDSLTHIHLVVAVEKHFAIVFTSKEIQSWSNVGKMIDSIMAKKA